MCFIYATEIPEVATTKRTGLKDFYGIDQARAVSFFTVHEDADLVHRQTEMSVLKKKCVGVQDQEAVVNAAGQGAEALWDFLSGVQKAYLTA